MNLLQKALREVRIVPAIGTVVVGVLVVLLITEHPDDPQTQLRDGITFEQDGTAVAGRAAGEGWLDLECNELGRVVVTSMEPSLEEADKGSFSSSACEDGDLSPGELNLDDIPEALRG
ncbi:MAG: hypothetical protein QG623_29 [Patescibacteria group bacterium]|nr:hypothetical protein [Patescibacteria group bacterium]